ncbi:MAG: TIGR03943 family putative permease subunit [Oscillochloridaceae bacterium umkhey_bin13]
MTTLTHVWPRRLNLLALTEVVLLGGTATLFLARWLRGQLDYYIHPRYSLLVLVASLVLLMMAAVRVSAVTRGPSPNRPGWLHLLLATPLLLGLLVPARPLGADTLAGRGIQLNTIANPSRAALLDDDTANWNLLDWGTALSVRSDELEGKPADVIGFVFPDPKLGGDAFYVARYVVTCCAADGAGVGLPVVWKGGGDLPANGWVRVQGTIALVTLDGLSQPALRAETVEPVPQPSNPYLYP